MRTSETLCVTADPKHRQTHETNPANKARASPAEEVLDVHSRLSPAGPAPARFRHGSAPPALPAAGRCRGRPRLVPVPRGQLPTRTVLSRHSKVVATPFCYIREQRVTHTNKKKKKTRTQPNKRTQEKAPAEGTPAGPLPGCLLAGLEAASQNGSA